MKAKIKLIKINTYTKKKYNEIKEKIILNNTNYEIVKVAK